MADEPPPTNDLAADPGPDPMKTLREIEAAKPQFGCLGCVVSGGWALAALVIVIALLVYAIVRLV